MTDSIGSPGSSGASPARERPLGVTIIAVLAAISGVLGLLGALALFSVAGAVGGLGLILALLLLVVSAVSLVFAYGAWTLQSWAWTLGVVLQALSILNGLNRLVSGDLGGILTLVIAGVILWYLFQPEVKAAFGRR